MPPLTLKIRNFRALRRLDWTIDGVCVLAGANGAGKSSALGALRFLRNTALRGTGEAARYADAGSAFRHLGSAPEDDVVFEVTSGDWRWRLGIPVEGRGVHAYNAETLWRGDDVVLDIPRLQARITLPDHTAQRDRTGNEIATLHTVRLDEDLGELLATLRAIRVYDDFKEAHPQGSAPETNDDEFLHPDGRNLASVLSSWKSAPRRFDQRFEWVLHWARRAFPDLIDDLEFTPHRNPRFYSPHATSADASLPLHLAAAGLYTGLLQLTAVAGARPGSTIAFDEMENQLHPHAIRTLIAAMRERAEERGLNIVLTTHSPVVLNQFRDEPEQVFVLGHQEPGLAQPARMTDLHDEAWLAQAKLGSLYERLAFGAPPLDAGEP